MTDHPITPPPKLVQEWANQSPIQHSDETWAYELFIAHQAARWGADQELEACCQWQDIFNYQNASNLLRAARRPEPPSLAEEALKALDHLCVNHPKATDQEKTILRAIKRLQELENNG